jgi:hypothetical protein
VLGEERLRSGSTLPPVGRRRVTSGTCSTHCVLQSLTPSGSPAETSALSWVWRGRQKMALERWTNPKLSRRMCTCEYGLQLCRWKSAGVAKWPA